MIPRLLIRLRFDEVFNEEMLPCAQYLNKISKKDLEFAIAGLVVAIDQKGLLNSKNLINSWFSDNSELRDRILDKIKSNGVVLNVYSSLKLVEYVLSTESFPSKTLINNSEVKLNLLKAYLTFNTEQENIEHEGIGVISHEYGYNVSVSSFFISMSIHDSEFINCKLVDVLFSQIGKAIFFFKYLEDSVKLQPHLEAFLFKYNCQNWTEWIKIHLSLFSSVLTQDNVSDFDLIIPDDEHFENRIKFLNSMKLEEDENFKNYDFLTLRSKPLLKLSRNKYRILFKLFVIEKLYKSLIFEFKKNINPSLEDKYQIRNFNVEHTNNFSEQTLLYGLIKNSFPNSWLKIPGAEFLANGYDSEPDFYLRFKNKLFLFESKDVLIDSKLKQSRDFNLLLDELSNKFYKTIQNGKVKNRAVLQLVKNVKRVLTNFYSDLDNSINVKSINIYPILVIHDRTFDCLGVNQVIRHWFRLELEKISSDYDISKVRDLVVLNVDELLLHQDILVKRRIRLEKVIDKYLIETKMNSINPHTPIELLSPYMISFSWYLTNEIESKNLKLPPEYINKLGEFLFPQ